MTEPAAPPPTAHEDDESEAPLAGVDSPSSPDVNVLDPQAPRLAGKRADEHDAETVDGSTPSFREG